MSSTRLAELERENVALQEEILALNRQLTRVCLGKVPMEDNQPAIDALTVQVERALAELKAFRTKDTAKVDSMGLKKPNLDAKRPEIFDLDQLLS